MITLAFYKGWGGSTLAHAGDLIIRLVCRSRFSHVELIAGLAVLGDTVECWSSSFRDGGVRCKSIWLDPKKWELVYVDIPAEPAVGRIVRKLGMPYDFLGAILSPWEPKKNIFGKGKMFCSEIGAEGMCLSRPWAYSPARLHSETNNA